MFDRQKLVEDHMRQETQIKGGSFSETEPRKTVRWKLEPTKIEDGYQRLSRHSEADGALLPGSPALWDIGHVLSSEQIKWNRQSHYDCNDEDLYEKQCSIKTYHKTSDKYVGGPRCGQLRCYAGGGEFCYRACRCRRGTTHYHSPQPVVPARQQDSSSGHVARLGRRMNTNGLDRGAMTRSSTTSSDTSPWLTSGTNVCQAQSVRTTTSILSPSAPAHDHHFMLPGAPASALGGVYRPPLTLSELSRHPYPAIYTTTGTSLPPFPSSIYTYGQSAGVSPLSPYGLYHPYPHPAGYSPSPQRGGDMQSFSQLIQRLGSQHTPQPQLPHAPFHVPPQYPGQPLSSPTGSPGPSGAPHQPLHPSPIHQLPPSALRRLPSGSSPHEAKSHFSGLSTKDLPPPSGTKSDPKGLPYSSSKAGSDGDYMHHHHRRPPGAPHGLSTVTFSGQKSGDSHTPPKKPKLGPPPLHSTHPSSHTATSSTPSSSFLPPPPPLQPASYPSQPHYPPHFMKGSIIQLANGDLKRVEDLRTEDFVNSADISPDLKIDSSTVVRIEREEDRGTVILGFSVGEQRIQVTVEATLEHPFFVFGQGWSSCSPTRTLRRYGLPCSQLLVGDVCISLTQKMHEPVSTTATTRASPAPPRSSLHPATCRSSSASPQSGELRTSLISGSKGSATRGESSASRSSPDHKALPSDTTLPHSPDDTGPGTQDAQPGAVGSRKRRWSAPDQLSGDSLPEDGQELNPEGSEGGGPPEQDPPQPSSQPSTSTTTTAANNKRSPTDSKLLTQAPHSKTYDSHRHT